MASSWANILAGKSGIQAITHFDVGPFSTRFGGPIYGFEPTKYVSQKDVRKMDKFIHYGVAAGTQAIEDSGLEITDANRKRIGVAIGSGIGGITGIENNYEAYRQAGPRKISPFFVPANIVNMVAGNLSIKYGLKGPNYSIVSACSTGTHNIGEAALMIRHGMVDCMIAGGAEMAKAPIVARAIGPTPRAAKARFRHIWPRGPQACQAIAVFLGTGLVLVPPDFRMEQTASHNVAVRAKPASAWSPPLFSSWSAPPDRTSSPACSRA